MPELPEVEEVRRTLEPVVLNVPVRSITVYHKNYVRLGGKTISRLAGRYVCRTLRHGKKLFCLFDDGQILLFHLGMSGRISCCRPDERQRPHTHLTILLASGYEIRMEDPRRFGGVWHYASWTKAQAAEIAGVLGVDALELEPRHLAAWRTSRARLKSALLSQRTVAGLGNIYVDESLWLAHLHPLQMLNRIPAEHYPELIHAIRSVLNKSIGMGGTTLRDYRNVAQQKGQFATSLCVYGRGGLPCLRCGTTLASRGISGRTTVFCPKCQRRR